jgi:hypothetical protein
MSAYGPRRINVVSITLLLFLLGAGYCFWRFFPVYFDAWSVDHILKESALATYQMQRLGDHERIEQLKRIADEARAKIIRHVGIEDPELTVNLNVDGDRATLTADYKVVVTHPWFDNRTTTMHLHRAQSANIKFVKWD